MISIVTLAPEHGGQVYGQAADSGTDTESGTGYVDVDNQSITFTTYGRPVFVFLSAAATNSTFQGNIGGTSRLRITRDGTVIYEGVFDGSGAPTNGNGHPAFFLYDEVAAGSHTYVLQQNNQGGSSQTARSLAITAYEMGT